MTDSLVTLVVWLRFRVQQTASGPFRSTAETQATVAAPDRLRSLERPLLDSRFAASPRPVTVERWSTSSAIACHAPPSESHPKGNPVMRRLALFGKPGRRLAEGRRRQVMVPAWCLRQARRRGFSQRSWWLAIMTRGGLAVEAPDFGRARSLGAVRCGPSGSHRDLRPSILGWCSLFGGRPLWDRSGAASGSDPRGRTGHRRRAGDGRARCGRPSATQRRADPKGSADAGPDKGIGRLTAVVILWSGA
jgi:hypothetical protein